MRIIRTQTTAEASVEVTPAERVIEKFGGLTKLARSLNCAVSTVQGWKVRGRIPQEHWVPIITAGQGQEIDLRLEDFVAPPSKATTS